VVLRQAKLRGHPSGRFELAPMALAVIKGQTDHTLALLQGQGSGGGGVEPA